MLHRLPVSIVSQPLNSVPHGPPYAPGSQVEELLEGDAEDAHAVVVPVKALAQERELEIKGNLLLTTKLSLEGPIRMKEEYVEGIFETPTISEESIPEQLKGPLGQAAGSLQQLPTPIKDAFANGLRIPLNGTYQRLFMISYLDEEILGLSGVGRCTGGSLEELGGGVFATKEELLAVVAVVSCCLHCIKLKNLTCRRANEEPSLPLDIRIKTLVDSANELKRAGEQDPRPSPTIILREGQPSRDGIGDPQTSTKRLGQGPRNKQAIGHLISSPLGRTLHLKRPSQPLMATS
ncbi:hypothetical protein Taro_006625, partial [Colocasia esculenta]|nr:hypothetical protein [Colocasia esculenta]